MDKFFEDFTIIDFMAMFIPGAFYILLTEKKPFLFSEICINFFGEENDIALAIYFIILSYMIGTLFIECSKYLENIFCKDLVGDKYATSDKYLNSQAKSWFINLPNRPLFSDIKVAVFGKGSYKKRMIFSAFYEMCRTMLIAIPACIITRFLTGHNIYIFSTNIYCHKLILNFAFYFIILFLIKKRMCRFLKLTVEYTYADYYEFFK